MQETDTNIRSNDFDDEINLRELFHVLWQRKWFIVSLTSFVSIIGVIYSLSLPNIYTSNALLVRSDSSGGISNALGNLGGLAGIAGISLSPNNNESNTAKALIKIRSLSFFENNILPNIFLPDLMAVKSWDGNTNILTYDENIYKMDSNIWVSDDSHPNQQKPSVQKSFRVFIQHLSVIEDIKSGFITISIKHQSPFIAKQWTELVIDEANSFYRQKDKSESEKAASYLNEQISMAGLSEIKQILAQLLQEEIKKLTLIEANEAFVFDYIDPPAVMEIKSSPERAVICILSAILGSMLSILLVLIRHYFFREKAS